MPGPLRCLHEERAGLATRPLLSIVHRCFAALVADNYLHSLNIIDAES
jgi:hypothetical protein